MAAVYESAAATATGTPVATQRGLLGGVVLLAGTDAATVVLRDGDASGVVLVALGVAAGLSKEWEASGAQLGGGVSFKKGLHATLTGTSPRVIVYYR